VRAPGSNCHTLQSVLRRASLQPALAVFSQMSSMLCVLQAKAKAEGEAKAKAAAEVSRGLFSVLFRRCMHSQAVASSVCSLMCSLCEVHSNLPARRLSRGRRAGLRRAVWSQHLCSAWLGRHTLTATSRVCCLLFLPPTVPGEGKGRC
jgi:hypothetical protein